MNIREILHLSGAYFNYLSRNAECNYAPIRIWIEVTNNCNLQCRLCPNSEIPHSKKGYMDFSIFKKIADSPIVSNVRDIYLFHRGEPFLHPGLFKMIEYLKIKNNKAKVMIHTNATLLDKNTAGKVLDSGLDLISFSFDGYTKKTYEKNRINSSYEKTLKNIKDFLELKESENKRKPYTVLQVMEYDEECSCNDSPEQKKNFLKNFKKFPPDRFLIRKPHNWGGLINTANTCSTTPDNKKNRNYSIDYGIKNNGNNGSANFKDNIKYVPCTFLWYGLVFLFDGKILPCPQDFNEKLILGNVNDVCFNNVFNNEEIRMLRKKIALGKLQELQPCSKCDRLWRKTFLGIPVDYLIPFLKDTLAVKP